VKIVAPPAPAELAGRSAKRAAAAEAKVNLLPAEYSSRYREQFFDRLWLHGLGYAGVIYAVCLVIYFCAVGFLGYRTRGVESQVAAISGSYTNAIQLKARLGVLQERAQLKYAALDCWQLIAQELPPGVMLQRSSFVDGRKVSLAGQVAAADIQKLTDFYDALRKVKMNNQPMFNVSSDVGDQLNYRNSGGMAAWNFALELLHTEAEVK
jgi:hypothetical protein